LQRLDPAAEDILIAAAGVTLYNFNVAKNQGEHADVSSLI
jgi:hypothetical protein